MLGTALFNDVISIERFHSRLPTLPLEIILKCYWSRERSRATGSLLLHAGLPGMPTWILAMRVVAPMTPPAGPPRLEEESVLRTRSVQVLWYIKTMRRSGSHHVGSQKG